MKRFLPRFSLVTAVVMMFAAGGLIWLNVRRVELSPQTYDLGFEIIYSMSSRREVEPTVYPATYRQGWPLTFRDTSRKAITIPPGTYTPEAIEKLASKWRRPTFNFGNGALDLAIALAILAAVGTISEFIVRKAYRARRGPGTDANRT